MIKNLIQSVLHIVGSENVLRPEELEKVGEKTIAEIFNEEKNTKEDNTEVPERS